MSMIDKIQKLTIDRDNNKENLEKLEEALREYHKLVEDGTLIPRGNTIESHYTTYTFNSNFNT